MEKLSEKLRELSPSNGVRGDYSYCNGWSEGVEKASQLAEAYEAEWEKRVAELEAAARDKRRRVVELEAQSDRADAEIRKLDERIRNLQSQLAWTPVSDGLPTEPGYYLFTNNESSVMLYRRGSHKKWTWESVSGAKFTDERMKNAWDEFRRVTLPEPTT